MPIGSRHNYQMSMLNIVLEISSGSEFSSSKFSSSIHFFVQGYFTVYTDRNYCHAVNPGILKWGSRGSRLGPLFGFSFLST